MHWTVTEEKILTLEEITRVIADLKRKARRSPNTWMNLVLFRLSTCCGLRVSELTRLTLNNVRVGSGRPTILVPKGIAKGKKRRVVPIMDQGTLDDLRAWKAHRDAAGGDLFITTRTGGQIDRRNARRRFKAACSCLGKERVDQLTIHHGRHSFISHALHAGRSVVEVQRAAGHASLHTTSLYAHLVTDDCRVGDIFV